MDINGIAQRAGVSRATVSRYLNNGYVSKQKRELIRRVIEETGYVPSHQAQQLRTGKTNLVGVIIPKINSQSISRMVAGITEVMSLNDYQVVLGDTNNNVKKEIDFLRLFNTTRVDGVVLIATVLTKEHRAVIRRLKSPLVILGQNFEEYSCVYQDDYHAMYDVTALVLPKALHPAYLGVFEQDEAAGRQRHQGFLDACAHAGLDVPPQAQRIVSFDADSGFFGAEHILQDMPEVDTIVCATDDIAYGAMMCMNEYGKRVPEDVQVTGIGDSLLTRISRPSLTTAHLHYKTSGNEAAKLLLNCMETGKARQQSIKLLYEVYARNSTR